MSKLTASSRTAIPAFLALTFLGASPAMALTDAFSLADANQSLFAGGGGGETSFAFNTPAFVITPSFGPGISCTAGVCAGFDASLFATGQVGLDLSAGASGGTANVTLPLGATLNVSSNYLSAPSFSVSVSGGLQASATPILAISPPAVQASLGAHVLLDASVSGEVCYVAGCQSGSTSLVSINTSSPLVGIDTSKAKPLTVLGASLPIPGFNTPQNLTAGGRTLGSYEAFSPTPASGGVVTSNRTATLGVNQPVLTADVDVPEALHLPGSGLSASIPGILGLNFTALDFHPSVSIGLNQTFAVNAPLDEQLRFSAPVNEIVGGVTIASDVTTIALGVSDPNLPSSATLQWAGAPGHLVSRTYVLDDPSLDNQTNAVITPAAQVTAFAGSISVAPALGGPTVNFCAYCNLLTKTFDQSLYNQAAPLAFGTQSFNFAAPAAAAVSPGSLTLVGRVGGAAPTASVAIANTADAGSDSLGFSASASHAPFSGSGNGTLTPGQDANQTITLRTNNSGEFIGQDVVKLQSDGNNSGVASSLTTQTVDLKGKVWAPAVAAVTRSVNFGIVHVGDSVAAQSISVANTAKGALTDQIVGGWGTAPSPFSTSGTLGGGVDAGSSSNHLAVGLDTSASGKFSGQATLALASHDPDLADIGIAAGPVALTAQVNNFALAGFRQFGGAGSFAGGAGGLYTLDFGIVTSRAGLNASIGAVNLAGGVADVLGGAFGEIGTGFGIYGASEFNGVAAGGAHMLNVFLDAAMAGSFTEDLVLDSFGSNPSGYEGTLAPIMLQITADFQPTGPVPEPASVMVLFAGLLGLGFARASFGDRRG